MLQYRDLSCYVRRTNMQICPVPFTNMLNNSVAVRKLFTRPVRDNAPAFSTAMHR